jgi:hypothetical protein
MFSVFFKTDRDEIINKLQIENTVLKKQIEELSLAHHHEKEELRRQLQNAKMTTEVYQSVILSSS